MRHARALPLTFVLLFGCNGAAKDFENICHAEERSGAASISDPSERAMRTRRWIENNVSSTDAQDAIEALATIQPEQRGAYLRLAARESGYTGECPMADAP